MRTSTLATLSLSLLFACGGDPETIPTPPAKAKAKTAESTEAPAQPAPRGTYKSLDRHRNLAKRTNH